MFSFWPGSPIRAIPYTSLWFGILVWGLITAGFTAGAAWILDQDYLFAYHSQATTGRVERKFVKVSHGRHGPSYTPCLEYHYQVANDLVDSQMDVRTDTYKSVSPFGPIPLLYLTAQIADNRIDLPPENQRIQVISYALAGTSLVLLIGGIWIIVYLKRRNQLNRRLLAGGLSSVGTVTSKNFDVVGKAQTKRFYLLFTFRDQRGAELNGRTWYLTSNQEDLWSEQKPIRVYYDSTDSRKFTVDLNRP
jgi:hypothetical protein